MLVPGLHWLAALALAPLLPGVVNRVKAGFAGRRGPSVFQTYRDLRKGFRKAAVYSTTTTFVFRLAPVVGVAAMALGLALVPWGSGPALVHFTGDVVLWLYLLVGVRLLTVWAALDTGSSFEGMGASRELWFSVLAEPALLLCLATLARRSHSVSLSGMLCAAPGPDWASALPALLLVGVAWFVLLLAENSRMPVDDPNTHLELTMLHEVMRLDHGGPDLSLLEYAGALKFMLYGIVLVRITVPVFHQPWLDAALGWAGVAVVAVAVGVVESAMARLRLNHVPQVLAGAAALAGLALILTLR